MDSIRSVLDPARSYSSARLKRSFQNRFIHWGMTMNTINTNNINGNRSVLEKYMPLLIGLLAAFLAGKALKKMFWTAFGMYWALRASGIHLFG